MTDITPSKVYEMFSDLKDDISNRFEKLYEHLAEQYVSKSAYDTLCERTKALEAEVSALNKRVYGAAGIVAIITTVITGTVVAFIQHVLKGA